MIYCNIDGLEWEPKFLIISEVGLEMWPVPPVDFISDIFIVIEGRPGKIRLSNLEKFPGGIFRSPTEAVYALIAVGHLWYDGESASDSPYYYSLNELPYVLPSIKKQYPDAKPHFIKYGKATL